MLCGQGRRHHVLGSVRATATSTSWCHLYACVPPSHEPWHQGWSNPHCLSLIRYTKCCHMMRGFACPTGLGSCTATFGRGWYFCEHAVPVNPSLVSTHWCGGESSALACLVDASGLGECVLVTSMYRCTRGKWTMFAFLRGTLRDREAALVKRSPQGAQGPHTGAWSPTHAKL